MLGGSTSLLLKVVEFSVRYDLMTGSPPLQSGLLTIISFVLCSILLVLPLVPAGVLLTLLLTHDGGKYVLVIPNLLYIFHDSSDDMSRMI